MSVNKLLWSSTPSSLSSGFILSCNSSRLHCDRYRILSQLA